nr:integrase, catalytic region, zinc finger, CCHC-type, peptidase aspartic, catalytic [Tanacetum cinerariifolium]
ERGLNELKHDDKASTSFEPSQEIESLKHTLSVHLKEKESLEQKITILKNDFQKEESRNIDRELALEKQSELSAEQAFWSQYLVQTNESNLSATTTIVEVSKELPKVIMEIVKSACLNVDVCAHYVTIESELKNDFLKKECYETLLQKYHILEKHYISLEVHNELKMEIFQRNTLSSSESALTFAELFKINELKAQDQEKDTVILKLKEKLHSLNVLTEAVSLNPIDPDLLKVDVAPLVPKLRKNRTAHTDYIRHTQDEAATLREIVESERLLSPLNTSLDYAYNTKKNRIRRTQRKAKKNKIEDHLRTIKSSLNKKSVVDSKATSSVINYVSNVNSDLKCASCNGCLFFDNHDACVVDYIKFVNASSKSKSIKTPIKRKVWKTTRKVFKTVGHIWKPTGRTFTLIGNVCPLTRIATTTIVPPKEPSPIVHTTDKPVVTLVYSKKPKAANKKLHSLVANKMEPNSSWGSSSSNVSSPFIDSRTRHNLFSVGQFCDLDLEVAFCQHTCFIRNLDEVDLLIGSRGNNLYTLSLQDMMASSPICLLSKASKTKSWLWHRRLSHLNFKAINHLARQGLVRGLPNLKFEKDHLCSACAMGKSTKKTHKHKSEDTNQEKLYLLCFTWIFTGQCVSMSPETSVARSPQQNGVVERRNRILIEAARTIVVTQAPEVIAPIAEVIPQVDDDSTSSASSTTVDQDVPSTKPKTYKEALTQSCWIEAMQEER